MHLHRLLPSPNSLFVFEAAARNLNFTHAGAEFNVTQSAVSRSIARLEAHLGVRLFHRLSPGLALTEEGRRLHGAVTAGFRTVEATIEELRARDTRDGAVTVSVSAAFAMFWFLPRLDRFRAACPGIDLRFQLVHGEPVGPLAGVDLAIRFDMPAGAGLLSWKLSEELVMPVCAPAYLARRGPLSPQGDNRQHRLIHLAPPVRLPWTRYLAETGFPAAAAEALVFSDYAMVVQAAVKGRGIALGWWHVVAGELAQEGLVPAGGPELATGRAYHLVAAAEGPPPRPVLRLRDWLLDEMAALRAQFADGARGAAAG